MRVVFIFISIFVSLFIPFKAHAYDAPDRGIVYNTKETNALIYFCEKSKNDLLNCEFTQNRVQRKVKAEDLKTRLDEGRKIFHSDKKELERELSQMSESCKEINETSLLLQGRIKGKNQAQQDWVKNISDIEKKDLIKMSRVLTTFCNSKTLENYLDTIQTVYDRESRTCTVSSNSYTQSFRLVSDQDSGAFTWVAKGEPSGACGIIQLSRFEPEKLDNSNLLFWNYIAKKVVTNKQGFLFPGLACKDLDEDEYIFDWRSKDHALGCDYITFTP